VNKPSFDEMRQTMIDCQLRPTGVSDQRVAQRDGRPQEDSSGRQISAELLDGLKHVRPSRRTFGCRLT
jgi:hypothetical protein